jgi:CHAT domain-containing protein
LADRQNELALRAFVTQTGSDDAGFQLKSYFTFGMDMTFSIGLKSPSGGNAIVRAGKTLTSASCFPFKSPSGDDFGMRMALEAALRLKGLVLEILTQRGGLSETQLISVDRAKRSEFFQLRSEVVEAKFAALVDPTNGRLGTGTKDVRLAQLRQEIIGSSNPQRLNLEAVSLNAPTSLDAVLAAIPQDAVLLEYFKYRPFNSRATRDAERWGSPRYLVFVLRHNSPVVWCDLDLAAEIDDRIFLLRDRISESHSAEQSVKVRGRELAKAILDPIWEYISNAKSLIVSPDARLNLVPFGVLPDEAGDYLIIRRPITYVSSGRELLRTSGIRSQTASPLIMAYPDFDNSGLGDDLAKCERGELPIHSDSINPRPAGGGIGSASQSGARSWVFSQKEIRHTCHEAYMSAARLQGGVSLISPSATESVLKNAHGPTVLHVATHAFFIQDTQPPENLLDTKAFWYNLRFPRVLRLSPFIVSEDLLRSGLALAGANQRKSDGKNGLLTSFELASVDLHGTRLAVLSACETGLGRVEAGEGILGLRSALTVAGAESQVISLWRVEDPTTSVLMSNYYRFLSGGMDTAEALRQSQLQVMSSAPEKRHPFYWAAFVHSGVAAPIDPTAFKND